MSIGLTDTLCVAFVAILLIFLSVVVAWGIAAWRARDVRRWLCAAESVFLIAVVILLAWGTRDTVLKVVDSFQRDKVVFSEDQNKAVLEAYDKLSSEMNRWSVMFVVLGSFFGLVLPIGAYLLQMKEIARKEGAVDAKFAEEARQRKKSIETADLEIKKMRDEFRSDVGEVWQAQAIVQSESFYSVLRLLKKTSWESVGYESRRELLTTLMLFLRCLENTKLHDFVVQQLSRMTEVIRYCTAGVKDDLLLKITEGLDPRSFDFKIHLSKYCVDNEMGMNAFKAVQEFGCKIGCDVLV